jgi:hypothetical protein
VNQPPPPYPQQPQQPQQPFAPYPGGPSGPGWQGGPPLPPPPPPKGGRAWVIVGLSGALAIAVIALVVVLLTNGKDDDGGTASPGGDHGTSGTGHGGAATAHPAAPSGRQQQQAPPETDYERVAFDYVSAVQNNDVTTAQSLACPSFRAQVKVAPLGLRSPTGVTVDKIDTFQLGGANATTDANPGDTGPGTLIKAKVGIRVQDGENWVQWIFTVLPEHGQAQVCGQSVLDKLDLVPDVN